MRLAMLAIRVPRPPRFVPITKALPLSVNAERRSAAGTLLITWEDTTAVSTGDFQNMLETASLTEGILPIFTTKTKTNTNVMRSV